MLKAARGSNLEVIIAMGKLKRLLREDPNIINTAIPNQLFRRLKISLPQMENPSCIFFGKPGNGSSLIRQEVMMGRTPSPAPSTRQPISGRTQQPHVILIALQIPATRSWL